MSKEQQGNGADTGMVVSSADKDNSGDTTGNTGHTGHTTGKQKSKSKLPLWLHMAIRKPRVWKTWVRCMVATFATLVIMIVQPCKPNLLQASY